MYLSFVLLKTYFVYDMFGVGTFFISAVIFNNSMAIDEFLGWGSPLSFEIWVIFNWASCDINIIGYSLFILLQQILSILKIMT